MALVVLGGCGYGVYSTTEFTWDTSGTEHALTVAVGFAIAVSIWEPCVVLTALDMLARLKDELIISGICLSLCNISFPVFVHKIA